jgi:hypothetical protein
MAQKLSFYARHLLTTLSTHSSLPTSPTSTVLAVCHRVRHAHPACRPLDSARESILQQGCLAPEQDAREQAEAGHSPPLLPAELLLATQPLVLAMCRRGRQKTVALGRSGPRHVW